ncbi:putative F-box protein At1g32420 [Papaver somniferum]|uniref:putative F-box protein At1g32420 n=1 Tax=Papaver somniferum TaxID=3469 RepID=UPI000E700C8F|nr:putative F-box protein At1g32420 [Papaver somniferum]
MEHHPFESAKLVGIWGSCNGLVCLVHHNDVTEFVSLWNPATKEYKRIPDSPYLTVSRPGYFCYDGDYKLVYAVTHLDSFSVYVYNLRWNLWRTHQTKPYSFENLDGVLVNGALHWIARTARVIVSFDIRDESFDEIPLSGEILPDLKWSSQNGEYRISSEGTDLVFYCPKNSSTRRIKLGSLVIRGVNNYVESLVSLDTGTYVGKKEVILGTRKRCIWRK